MFLWPLLFHCMSLHPHLGSGNPEHRLPAILKAAVGHRGDFSALHCSPVPLAFDVNWFLNFQHNPKELRWVKVFTLKALFPLPQEILGALNQPVRSANQKLVEQACWSIHTLILLSVSTSATLNVSYVETSVFRSCMRRQWLTAWMKNCYRTNE